MTARDEAISKAKDLSSRLVHVNTREQAVQWMVDACMLLDKLPSIIERAAEEARKEKKC